MVKSQSQLLADYLKERRAVLQQELIAIDGLLSKSEQVAPKKPKINWENEIVKIMKKGKGPFSKLMLEKELDKRLGKKVQLYHHTVMAAISSAVVQNKRFKRMKGGWVLNE